MTTGAEKGEIAEVGSPVIVAHDPVDDRAALRWTTTALVVTFVFLSITNASVAVAWLDELPQGRVSERVRPGVAAWEHVTARLDGSHAWLQAQWRRAHGLRFGDEQPGERGANDAPG